jgi:hypothetical protein
MAVVTKKNAMKPADWPLMLVTADDWFTGPDGNSYKTVYGPVDIATSTVLLGFEAKGNANYVVLVGHPGRQVVLMGCRVHYLAMCPTRPHNMNGILDLSGVR